MPAIVYATQIQTAKQEALQTAITTLENLYGDDVHDLSNYRGLVAMQTDMRLGSNTPKFAKFNFVLDRVVCGAKIGL
jgi:hypothetical protein